MLAQNYFYHGTIRRYTILFGSIFDGIKIFNGSKYVKVPLKSGGGFIYVKDKHKDSGNRKHKTPIFPYMYFKLIDFRYDEERKTNSHEKLSISGVNHKTENNKLYAYNRVPYTFSYALTIRAKTHDEGTQIVEQIAPYFTPDITFRIKDMDDTNSARNKLSIEPIQNVPVILMDISMEDDDNVLDNLKFKEYVMTFDLKGYMYKEVHEAPHILTIKENYQEYNTEHLLYTNTTTPEV